jgi:MerR family copper efflux transcriptional regulator
LRRAGPAGDIEPGFNAYDPGVARIRISPPPAETSEPIACTLGAEAMPGRLREWQAMLDRALERRTTATGVVMRFPRDVDTVTALASLTAREVDCCAFLTFTVKIAADGTNVTIDAPPDAVPLVHDVFGPR